MDRLRELLREDLRRYTDSRSGQIEERVRPEVSRSRLKRAKQGVMVATKVRFDRVEMRAGQHSSNQRRRSNEPRLFQDRANGFHRADSVST